ATIRRSVAATAAHIVASPKACRTWSPANGVSAHAACEAPERQPEADAEVVRYAHRGVADLAPHGRQEIRDHRVARGVEHCAEDPHAAVTARPRITQVTTAISPSGTTTKPAWAASITGRRST